MIFGIAFLIILFILLIWLCVKYFILKASNTIARKAFEKLHIQINKRYDFILNALNNKENSQLTSDTRNLIEKAKNFSAQKDGIDRIIRFSNAIFENAEHLSALPENDNDFNNAKNNYNKCAQKLRHYVDVFPTSLMARFADIKLLDLLH